MSFTLTLSPGLPETGLKQVRSQDCRAWLCCWGLLVTCHCSFCWECFSELIQYASLLALLQVRLMEEHGYVVGNLDCTIIAQKPKLSPHKVRCMSALCLRLKVPRGVCAASHGIVVITPCMPFLMSH